MTHPTTIFAEATPPGAGALAVIRISGRRAREALKGLGAKLPPPRQATLRHLKDAKGRLLDQALVLFFPGPASYTGEDVIELHVHGGRAVRRDVLEMLAQQPGLTPAEPGAFTRRAFDNGRLDLTQAEAVGDLVAAETAAQRRQALRQLGGELSARIERWREALLSALAQLEASLDFADEGEVPDTPVDISSSLHRVLTEITQDLAAGHRGERIREGIEVAILGPPNAGKSTLVNALARRQVAIISPRPGTTRDIIEVNLDLGGFPVTVCDTAGLREAADELESEGIRRALDRAEAADLTVLLLEPATALNPPPDLTRHIAAADLVAVTKADLFTDSFPMVANRAALTLSVHSGLGLSQFEEALRAAVSQRFADHAGELAPTTRLRHRDALEGTAAALARALSMDPLAAPELLAEDVRLATRQLGRITGRVDVEDLLDRIFAGFCIGK